MSLVAFFGDTHGNLKFMWEMALAWEERTGLKLEWIFQVGDFGVYPTVKDLDPSTVKYAERNDYPLSAAVGDFPEVVLGDYKVPIPTYFIRGNHECQEFLMTHEKQHELRHKKKGAYLNLPIEICPNLFYVPDGHIITLNGYRIAGLGGCWSYKTWPLEYWSEARTAVNKKGHARRLNHSTRDRWERLMRSQFDILVTHDAPTGVGLHGAPDPSSLLLDPESLTTDQEEGLGMRPIRELIETVQPLYQFGGHWHEYQKNRIGGKFGEVGPVGDGTIAYVLDKTVDDGVERHCMEVIELNPPS